MARDVRVAPKVRAIYSSGGLRSNSYVPVGPARRRTISSAAPRGAREATAARLPLTESVPLAAAVGPARGRPISRAAPRGAGVAAAARLQLTESVPLTATVAT